MKRTSFASLVVAAAALSLPGCGESASPDATAPTTAVSAQDGEYVLKSEPENAAGVIATRQEAQDGDEVVVVGRIGGSENPWIDGRAAFSIVDSSLQACSDRPGDACPVPWDYCCETDKLPEATALVKVVDDQGKLAPTDARELLGVKELQTVVVRGKAQRDETGNLTILASGVYVHP
jgi:hypothetical protein